MAETKSCKLQKSILSKKKDARKAAGGTTMSTFTSGKRVLAGSFLAGLVWAVPTAQAAAQQKAAPPDFSSNHIGWVGVGGGGPGFVAVPGRLPPVTSDPAHPFVPNG